MTIHQIKLGKAFIWGLPEGDLLLTQSNPEAEVDVDSLSKKDQIAFNNAIRQQKIVPVDAEVFKGATTRRNRFEAKAAVNFDIEEEEGNAQDVQALMGDFAVWAKEQGKPADNETFREYWETLNGNTDSNGERDSV